MNADYWLSLRRARRNLDEDACRHEAVLERVVREEGAELAALNDEADRLCIALGAATAAAAALAGVLPPARLGRLPQPLSALPTRHPPPHTASGRPQHCGPAAQSSR